MSGVIDFITGDSAGKQADAAEAGAEIAREQAGMGREQWQEYKKNLYPGERDFIQEAMGYDPAEIQRYNDAQAEIAQIEAKGPYGAGGAGGGLGRPLSPGEIILGGARSATGRLDGGGISAEDKARLDALRLVPRPTSRRSGLGSETTAGLSRIDDLARRDPSIDRDMVSLSGMADSPVSAQDYLSASRENIDYWNTDPSVLNYEAQRAAESAQQESDAELRDAINQMAAYGINPASGRFAGTLRRASLGASANRISAINKAIGDARAAEYGRKVDAYGRRLHGMGLANETAQGNFARRAGILDTRRAMGLDDFNKGLQAFSTREGAKLTDFNKRMGAVGLGKGVGTQGIQLLGQGQVGMQNTASTYGQIADRSNQMVSDLIGAGLGAYGYSQLGKK